MPARRPSELTRQLLAFSRKQSLKPASDPTSTTWWRHRPAAARGRWASTSSCRPIAARRPVADLCRPRPGRDRADQSLHQCARRHADGRPRSPIETRNVTLDADYVARQDDDVAPATTPMLSVTDTGTRHAARASAAGLRAVLHHQGGRQGHRPWPQHGLRLHQAVQRPYRRSTARSAAAPTFEHLLAAQRRRRPATGAAQPAPMPAAASASWWSRTMPQVRAIVGDSSSLGYDVS